MVAITSPVALAPVDLPAHGPLPRSPGEAPHQLKEAVIPAPEGHRYSVSAGYLPAPYDGRKGSRAQTISIQNERNEVRAQLVTRAGGFGKKGQNWTEEVQIFLPEIGGGMTFHGAVRGTPDGKLHRADFLGADTSENAHLPFTLSPSVTSPDGKSTQTTLRLLTGDTFTLHNAPGQALRIEADNNVKGIQDEGDWTATVDGKHGKSTLDVFAPAALGRGNDTVAPAHINEGLEYVGASHAQAILDVLKKDRNSADAGRLYREMLAAPLGGFTPEQVKNYADWELLRSSEFYGAGTLNVLKAMGFEEPEKWQPAVRGGLKFKETPTSTDADGAPVRFGSLAAAMALYRFGSRQSPAATELPQGFIGWMNETSKAGKAVEVLQAGEHVYKEQSGHLKEKDRDNSKDIFEGQPDNPGEFFEHLEDKKAPKIPVFV